MIPVIPKNFKALVAERINSATLRNNLKRATTTSLQKRAEVVRDFPDWEVMREQAHQIKKKVIDSLDAYIDEFERNASSAGAVVHRCKDAKEANTITLDICKRVNARSVVKSKSMVTEECGLREALEEHGIETFETDLGEYIVQLAHELPSHITAPALHKSREEIGKLFAETFHIPYTSNPEELTAIAREVLRKKFLTADVGISGVNFAIANTGSICVVENEGNARLSMSLPRIHIAFMGLEKVIPDLESLSLFLKVLARSATGQRITSYTSIITGPKFESEPDGPEELHIVIIDNGRTRMLRDPRLREALYCIRCGACLNVCPVYQKIGGHSYGSMYSGPIGSVITPVLNGIEHAKDLPFASSLCGACSEICPVRIDIHHMLLWLRKSAVEKKRTTFIERMLFRCWFFAMKNRNVYVMLSKISSFVTSILPSAKMHAPIWSRTRDFPKPAKQSFRELWQRGAGK